MPALPLSELLRLVVWLGLLGLIFIPMERLFPIRRAPILRPQIRADLAYYFINGLLPRLLADSAPFRPGVDDTPSPAHPFIRLGGLAALA
jgi:hypothetical protein